MNLDRPLVWSFAIAPDREKSVIPLFRPAL